MRTGVVLATSKLRALGLALVLAFTAITVVGTAAPARADDAGADEKGAANGHVVVDLVEVIPSRLGLARVRALISAIDFNGKRIPILGSGKGGLAIKLGSAKPSDALTGVFETSDAELALVVVVPVTYDFDADLGTIREHLKSDLLTPLQKQLGPRVQIAVLGYAESTVGSRKLGNMSAALGVLDQLEIDSTPPNLLAAAQRGVTLAKNAIKKPKNPGALVRGAVVIVSDGAGVSAEEHEAITKLGLLANKDHVRIHSIAYSPSGRKRPLFNLGELSRQSHGTFRFVRTEGGWTDQLNHLLDELLRQTVITFYAPPDELADKKLIVTVPLGGKALESDPMKLPDATCGPEACDGYCNRAVCVIPARAAAGGPLKWLLIGGGALVGLVLLVVGGTRIARRKRAGAGGPLPPHMMPPGGPGMPAPGVPFGAPGMPRPGVPFGAPAMPGAPPMPSPAPPAAGSIAPGAPIFIIVNGPQAGQRVALKHGFTIGKAAGSDLDLSHDGFASTNHAVVTFDGAAWQLIDQGSTNGTFVNGNRVQQVRLDAGTTVRLGSTEVRFWTA